ncbi:MAG: hypothetical protein ACR2MP_32430 [Streptosporangiaceae bacterium]
MFGALLALNHVYMPYRMIKWQRYLIGELTDADISLFCEGLSGRRRAVDPPSATP